MEKERKRGNEKGIVGRATYPKTKTTALKIAYYPNIYLFCFFCLLSSPPPRAHPPHSILGFGVPRGLHGQLEPFPANRRQRPGSRVLRRRRQDVLLQVRTCAS